MRVLANETDVGSKERSNSDINDKNLVKRQSRIKQVVCPKFYKIEVK